MSTEVSDLASDWAQGWVHEPPLLFPLLPVPQPVSVIQTASISPNKVTLTWPFVQPPSGSILGYEVKYYEKVSLGRATGGTSQRPRKVGQ